MHVFTSAQKVEGAGATDRPEHQRAHRNKQAPANPLARDLVVVRVSACCSSPPRRRSREHFAQTMANVEMRRWGSGHALTRALAPRPSRASPRAHVHPHNDGQNSSSHGTTGNIEIRGGKKWARADTDAGGDTVARVNACAFSPPRMAARVFRTGNGERGCADRHKWARAHADARGETVVRVTACAFSTPRKDKGTLRTGNN